MSFPHHRHEPGTHSFEAAFRTAAGHTPAVEDTVVHTAEGIPEAGTLVVADTGHIRDFPDSNPDERLGRQPGERAVSA